MNKLEAILETKKILVSKLVSIIVNGPWAKQEAKRGLLERFKSMHVRAVCFSLL